MKKRIGVVSDVANLYGELSAWDNLHFMARLHGMPRERRTRRVEELLRFLGLYDHRRRRTATLSTGQRKRLMIAAALIHEPQILFLDEPTTGLDVQSARQIRELLRELNGRGVTILLTTHYIEEADQLCQHIAIIHQGKIVAIDTPERLKSLVQREKIIDVSFDHPADQISRVLSDLDYVERVIVSGERARLYVRDPKDARIYFFKAPNLTFGLFLPLVLYWAFALDREVELVRVIPGLVAIAIFFGAGAIQAVSLPLERRTGTMHTLLAAPVTPLVVVLGKALAGLAFGLVLASAYTAVMLLFLPLRPNLILFSLAAVACSCCFSAFGLCLAVPFRDIPQAMPPATVVRIAMVFLSGAFAPLEAVSPSWLFVARLLPLTYAVDGLRQAVNGPASMRAFAIDLVVLLLYAVTFLGITAWLLGRSEHV